MKIHTKQGDVTGQAIKSGYMQTERCLLGFVSLWWHNGQYQVICGPDNGDAQHVYAENVKQARKSFAEYCNLLNGKVG